MSLLIADFDIPEVMSKTVLEGFEWLDTVNDLSIGSTVGVHEEEGSFVSKDGSLSIAGIAATNEFGTEDGRIPARPFMSAPFDDNITEFEEEIGDFSKVSSVPKLNKALAKTAETYRGKVIEGVDNRDYQKNAEYTIKKKGSDMPLRDTGRLMQSVLTKAI